MKAGPGLGTLSPRQALAFTGVACFASGWLAYVLVGGAMAPVIFWPPLGIALGAALLWGGRTLPAAFLGTALAAALQGMVWAEVLALGLSSVAQAGAGLALLRWRGQDGRLEQVRDLVWLVLLGGVAAAVLALPLTYFAMDAVDGFWEASLGQRLVSSFFAHVDAVLVFTPALICWLAAPCPRQGGRLWEATLVLLALVLGSLLLAHPHLFGQPSGNFRPYPLLPFLLWLALRTDPRFTVLGLVWVYVVSVSARGLAGSGLHIWTPGGLILPIHGFVAVISISFLALAVLTAVRNRMELALRESEERFRNLVNLTRNCIWEVDAQGRFTYADSHAEVVLGVAAEALLGRLPEEVWPEGMGNSCRVILRRALFSSEAQIVGQTRPGRDGATVYLETSCVPRFDTVGRHRGWQGITRDISDQVRMAQDLDDTHQRFRQLAENIEQIFWVSDRSMRRFVYLSPQCEEVYGVTREALLADPETRMPPIHPDDQAGFQAALEGVFQGSPIDIEYRIQHPRKGQRWIRSRSFPFTEHGGQLMNAGIVEDITPRKRAEEEHMAAALAQRDALIREVHHRIKNNLQTVVGLLRREANQYPEARPAIEAAIAQVQSVAVVHGLHGRVTQHSIMLCELLPAIVTAVADLHGVEIVQEGVPAGCGELRIKDSETVAVALILNELISNAVKHLARGDGAGPLLVRMSREDAQGPQALQGSQGHIVISNPGRLPARFDYASGQGVGTGLGLVRALMPKPGMAIAFTQAGPRVEVDVVIEAPVLNPAASSPEAAWPDDLADRKGKA